MEKERNNKEKWKYLMKTTGIFLLALLVMVIISIGINLICAYSPILGFIILIIALIILFIMIYKDVRNFG
jgi:uncharacterized membrane protein YjgN (DUF898 family)